VVREEEGAYHGVKSTKKSEGRHFHEGGKVMRKGVEKKVLARTF